MKAIADILISLVETIFSLIDFLFTFLGETFQMVLVVTKLPSILVSVLQWTNYCGILPYVTAIIALAILYKILGREG